MTKQATGSEDATVSEQSTHPLQDTQGAVRATRRYSALLGALMKAEVDAIFKQLPFAPLDSTLAPTDLWREARFSLSQEPAFVAGADDVRALPAEAMAVAEEVKTRQSYKLWYEAVADYDFALVPVGALLAPQWEVDLDYVEELAAKAPTPGDWSAALAFAMPEGLIGEPVVTQNQVIFSSHRRDLFCNQFPEVRPREPGVYEIVVTAHSRPNYLQVARIKDRLILTNGVHKTLAMSRAGFQEVPCLIRTAAAYDDLGLNRTFSFLRPEVVEGIRPALVRDFLDKRFAAPLLMRGMDQALRVTVIVEPLSVPALQSA